jgi:hypothetical protein
MIYKNFYNKYKMSQPINLEEEKKDIEDNNPIFEEESNVAPIIEDIKDDIKDDTKAKAEEVEEVEELEDIKADTKNDTKADTSEKRDNEIMLKLGDIILISDPTNEILNDQIFLIEYIDPTKIKLINSDTFEKTVLQISQDGIIGDGNIKAIKVISSNPENGYARQNDLLPGTWVNIYFGGEIPTVITGEITNIEEDMVEIRTTDGDTLFINFNYQGIPEDLPIETFEIRPAIKGLSSDLRQDDELGLEEGDLEEVDNLEGDLEEGVTVSKKIVKDRVQRMMFDLNDIEFGDAINVEEYETIDKDKYRYSIETQTNDMLE